VWDKVSVEGMRQAVLESVPPHTVDLNRRAFEEGVRYVEEVLHVKTK
jgi:Pyruvate/2-oxoacid:ferredoxin oxidoreductase gamma subunit